MAEPIVRSFVIDTTQAEQNLQSLNVVSTATNASLDGLYNQLINLDAQLQKLDPNSQAFAEVNTQIQQLETNITNIETGKIDDIGKAIQNIDAGNAAQSIEQIGDAVQQVVAPVNNLANATDQLNVELKDIPKDIAPDPVIPGDLIPPSVIENTKSLKVQLRELQAQLAATDPDSAKYRELSAAAGELKDKIQDAAQAVGTQAGGAFERVGGSLGLVTSRLTNLDFTGAAEGAKLFATNIGQVKFSDITNGLKGLASGFKSIGTALLANPIFLVVGAIAAVTAASIALYQQAEEDARMATEKAIKNIDRLAEKEKRINKLKTQAAADDVYALQKIKEDAARAELDFTNAKLDELDKLRKQDIDLSEEQITQYNALVKNANDQIVEIERIKYEKIAALRTINANLDKIIIREGMTAREKAFQDLEDQYQQQRILIEANGGTQEDIAKLDWAYQIQTNELKKTFANEDRQRNKTLAAEKQKRLDDELEAERKAAEQIYDIRKKNAEELAKITEQIRKDAAKKKEDPLAISDEELKNIQAKLLAQSNATLDAEELRIKSLEDGQEKEIALVDLKYARLRAAAQGNAELQKQIAEQNQAEVDAIIQKGVDKEVAIRQAGFKKGLDLASSAIQVLQAFSDASTKKGEADAKKKFRTDKALAIGAATVQTASAVTGALTAGGNPIKLATGQQFVEAGIAAALGIAQIVKIKNSQFGGGGDTGGSTPSVPSTGGTEGTQPAQFNPFANINVEGRPNQPTPRAYVLAGDVASQQEVRQKVEDLSRIG